MSSAVGKPVGPLLAARHEMPPTPFTRAQAVWLVRRLALMTVGGYELDVNDGPFVRLLHRITGTMAGDAWCAALQQFLLFILGGQNPLTAHAYCPDVAAEAERLGILDDQPEENDLVVFWHDDLGRFAHIGYLLAVHAGAGGETIEGNTNEDGARDGWRECKKHRAWHPNDRFVHWHRLVNVAAQEGA